MADADEAPPLVLETRDRGEFSTSSIVVTLRSDGDLDLKCSCGVSAVAVIFGVASYRYRCSGCGFEITWSVDQAVVDQATPRWDIAGSSCKPEFTSDERAAFELLAEGTAFPALRDALPRIEALITEMGEDKPAYLEAQMVHIDRWYFDSKERLENEVAETPGDALQRRCEVATYLDNICCRAEHGILRLDGDHRWFRNLITELVHQTTDVAEAMSVGESEWDRYEQ